MKQCGKKQISNGISFSANFNEEFIFPRIERYLTAEKRSESKKPDLFIP